MNARYEGPHSAASKGEIPHAGFNARRYLATLLIMTLLIWALPWSFMRLPRFLLWSGTYYGSMLEYAFVTADKNADVVIFGDSSALFGVDPLLLKARSGLNVINLPNTISSLPVTDDMSLRRYLARNAPPRLIVFYFAPWNLDYRTTTDADTLFEGEEMLARHGSARQLLAFLSAHPTEGALFPFRFYAANSLSIFFSRLKVWHEDPPIVRGRGHTDLVVPPSKLMKSSCRFPDKLLHESRVDSALELGRKYSTADTKVMFFMAPVPKCENADKLPSDPYTRLAAKPPTIMDPGYYDDDGYFIHVDRHGVPSVTTQLLSAIRSALRTDPLSSDPRAAGVSEPSRVAFQEP